MTVKYANQDRSRIICNENEKSALKAILNNGSASSVIKHLAKDGKYRQAMTSTVQKVVQKEVMQVLRRNGNIFRLADCTDLKNFQWQLISDSLRCKMPVFMSIIDCVLPVSKNKSLTLVITAISILLYGRSQLLNEVQVLLGMVLDSCGLTKEVIYN